MIKPKATRGACGRTRRPSPDRVKRARRRGGNWLPPPAESTRFGARVSKGTGAEACWLWTGTLNSDGYGVLGGKLAHRIAYERARGPISPGKIVTHACDRPACVRPDHLVASTDRENMLEKTRKGRQARGPRHSSRMKRYYGRHPQRHARGPRMARQIDFATAEAIRAGYAAGASQDALARQYGLLSQSSISDIVNGRRWVRPSPLANEDS